MRMYLFELANMLTKFVFEEEDLISVPFMLPKQLKCDPSVIASIRLSVTNHELPPIM